VNDKGRTIQCKLADFGTSLRVAENGNLRGNVRDQLFTNFNRFLTPLYASPNMLNNTEKINYYLEDVFSLGVTFYQMIGPYNSEELEIFNLNKKDSKFT